MTPITLTSDGPITGLCAHFDAHRCRSCDWLAIGYEHQLARKHDLAQQNLSAVAASAWKQSIPSRQFNFRNKAKLAALGTAGKLVFGLPANLAQQLGQHDLSDCQLYVTEIANALPVIRGWLNKLGIAPYDLRRRTGDLKYVLLSAGADQQLMLRLVLASLDWRARIEAAMPALMRELPQLQVLSINLQPIHQAIVEGPLEYVLSNTAALAVMVNDISLYLMPQSFFQTNTDVAAQLYQRAREWLAPLNAITIWDLYCGVGGFGLHLAGLTQSLVGVEINAAAVASAKRAAKQAGFSNAQFFAADAIAFAKAQLNWPSLLLLNPPRRGVGRELCDLIESSDTPYVLYSSCNPVSLARDLALLPSFTAERAQLFDLFPNTGHAEVLLLLKRS